jgi:hypothetical protein
MLPEVRGSELQILTLYCKKPTEIESGNTDGLAGWNK